MIPLVGPGFSLEQNIPLAILIVVLASFLFAGGATVQHLAVGNTVDAEAENRSMSLKQIWRLITTPKWLLGLALVGVGATMHIYGLMIAPVTVVQPVGILAVPWSVLLAAKIHHFRPTRAIWLAVSQTVLGIVVFTILSASTAAQDTDLPPARILAGCVIVYLIGATLGTLGARGPQRLRCLMWASGGSFFYGLSSALIKTITEIVKAGNFVERPIFWTVLPFLVFCYVFGGWMVQQGYANGPAEIVVGSMTTTDPVVGVAFGLIVLGEGQNITIPAAIGMVLAGAFAIYGVVVLSKHHPDKESYVGGGDGDPKASGQAAENDAVRAVEPADQVSVVTPEPGAAPGAPTRSAE